MNKIMFLLAITLISACSRSDSSKENSQSAAFISDETVKAAVEAFKTGKTGSDMALARKRS